MEPPAVCPVCGAPVGGVGALAAHLVERADASDGGHAMWLNRNVTRHRVDAGELEAILIAIASGDAGRGDLVQR